PRARVPGGHHHGQLDRGGRARFGEPPGDRHRHLAHRRAQPGTRAGRRLPAHQPGGHAEATMTDLLAPPIPELLDPWRTDRRLEIQAEARRFAMEEVLPLANELDPQKAEIPRWFLERMGQQGYFGITISE